jgi:hypothetical protein
MTRTLAIIAAVFSILGNTLHANPRTCRIVFPERPQDAPKITYLFDGKNSQKVTLPSMNLSEVIELPNGPLTLVMSATEITDPEVIPPKAPRLSIPEKIMDFYIIIVPDPKNQELPIKMNLVDTGAIKLKPGQTLWYNFTEHRIAAKLGTADMLIDPMGRTISKDPTPKSDYYTARFKYQAGGKGPYEPITEQYWWHDANSRHLGFMVNTGGKLPKIYFYRDFRLPKPTKEEAKAMTDAQAEVEVEVEVETE